MGSTFHIEHFGCRAARADGEAVASRLQAQGNRMEEPAQADVVIVNTCSVTAEADRAARAFIRRAHRLNPAARIVVTGCYAQRAPEELARMDGVSAVIGNSHKALAPEIVTGLMKGSVQGPRGVDSRVRIDLVQIDSAPQAQSALPRTALVVADDSFAHSFLEEAQLVPGGQTRPNLKIQEGCSNRCSFCVIPFTRGPSRSLPAEAVLRQVEGFVAAGGNELVVSGINLGRWGRGSADGKGLSLAWLVRRILAETALPRLRLSSIEPMDWDSDLVSILREQDGARPRLARHAHLPLQSGSDAVLRRMHRRYRPWHYADKVAALVAAAGPELTLGADVMVGFPGETEAEFEETLHFIQALPFGYLHLFPFSPRPGTALHAAKPMSPGKLNERMAALRALSAEKSAAHRRRFVGRVLEAITLHTPAELAARGATAALTENFLPVELAGSLPANRLVRVSVSGLSCGGALVAVPAR